MPAPTRIDPLRMRRTMGRDTWKVPVPFGPAGWRMDTKTADAMLVEGIANVGDIGRVMVTQSPVDEGDLTEWIHASFSWVNRVPTYDELMRLKLAVWGPNGEAYQVHPADRDHVNIHEFALHLWGRADGARVLPNFGKHGTI